MNGPKYVILTVLLVGAGCSSQGVGTGEVESPGGVAAERGSAVSFSWHSDGPSVTRGVIAAVVPGRGTFRGKYMQITSETDVEGVGPYFEDGWHSGWDTWDGWGPEWDDDDFVTNYSGRVIAVLRSETGEPMRCRFQLAEPDRGPAGGGMGECEVSDEEKITDVVLEKD